MIQIFINNEEVVCDKNINISEEILATSSTILNNCYPKSWENSKDYNSKFYYPKDYSKCKILMNDNLIFAGIVQNTGNISLNPRYPHYCNLQILDFKTLLSEGETLDFVISNKTIQEAIEMVVNAVSTYGFVVGNINIFNKDNIIGAYSTLNKSAYDVLQYLADISQSKWFTRILDDNSVAIDFYDPTLMERADNIKYTAEYFENNNIEDIEFSYGTRDYRNKQIMISDEVYGSINYEENITANGYLRNFTTSSKIGKVNEILVNSTPKTFATNDDKELGIEADFYYTPGSVNFESNENEPIISSNDIISISYVPLIKGRQIIYNDDEIARINKQLERKGIIARYESRNDVLSSEELNKIGQTYIRYKGNADVILKIKTYNKDLFKVGQITHFEAPLNELIQDYLVKKKETNIISTGNDYNVFYTYELSSSYNSENAINWFDNQRNKSSGNIQTGEYISRNIDIDNTANIIFNNLTIVEKEDTSGNVLDCTLDCTFNN